MYKIIHDNREWLDGLLEAFNLAGIDESQIELIDASRGGAVDLDAPLPDPLALYFNRVSPSSHIREARWSIEYAAQLIEWLESNNARVVNGSEALAMEISKVRQIRLCKRHNVPTPRTVALTGSLDSDDDFARKARALATLHFGSKATTTTSPTSSSSSSSSSVSSSSGRFIAKHNRGGSGHSVQLFKSADEFKRYIESEDYEAPLDGVWLLQQYIESPQSKIYRLEFVGAKFLYAVAVDTSQGFSLCPADSCSVADGEFCPRVSDKFTVLDDFEHPLIPRLEALLRSANISVAGIELINTADGHSLVYDINSNTNYNLRAEQQSKHGRLYGNRQLVHFLQSQLISELK
jgi:hypothetical protein